mgnify:CR=1 FL=1
MPPTTTGSLWCSPGGGVSGTKIRWGDRPGIPLRLRLRLNPLLGSPGAGVRRRGTSGNPGQLPPRFLLLQMESAEESLRVRVSALAGRVQEGVGDFLRRHSPTPGCRHSSEHQRYPVSPLPSRWEVGRFDATAYRTKVGNVGHSHWGTGESARDDGEAEGPLRPEEKPPPESRVDRHQ